MRDILYGKARKAISWLKGRPAIRRLRQRAPRSTGFIIDRFEPKNFIGLPLTLLLVVFAMNVALLSELAESVVESEEIVDVDKAFTTMLFEMRSRVLSEIFLILTRLADRSIVFLVGGIVSVVFIVRKHLLALAPFWTTLLGVGLSTRFGKTYFSRARPEEVAYYAVEHFSFPSGHATTAIALYGLIAYFLFRHYHKHARRSLIVWVSVALILSIGFSRIYLGVHYLSDVLAGYLLGALWLLVGISWMEMLHHGRTNTGKDPAPV